MNQAIIEKLKQMNACDDAVEWVWRKRSPDTAWRACKRGDWMLWLIGKLAGEPWGKGRKRLVLAVCECARLSLKYVKDDERPEEAIKVAERWAQGKRVSREKVRMAAYAVAHAAAYTAYAAAHAAAYAAYAAADAADAAAWAAAWAAACAVGAADAAADAAVLKQCADIVRKHYPEPPDILGEKS